MAAESPDRQMLASCRKFFSIDPPKQRLFLERPGQSRVLIQRLGEDTSWCDEIQWSEDGSTVAFVVNTNSDAHLLVADAETSETVFFEKLTGWTQEDPGSKAIADLTLSADGSEATYRPCPRNRSGTRQRPCDAEIEQVAFSRAD